MSKGDKVRLKSKPRQVGKVVGFESLSGKRFAIVQWKHGEGRHRIESLEVIPGSSE